MRSAALANSWYSNNIYIYIYVCMYVCIENMPIQCLYIFISILVLGILVN